MRKTLGAAIALTIASLWTHAAGAQPEALEGAIITLEVEPPVGSVEEAKRGTGFLLRAQRVQSCAAERGPFVVTALHVITPRWFATPARLRVWTGRLDGGPPAQEFRVLDGLSTRGFQLCYSSVARDVAVIQLVGASFAHPGLVLMAGDPAASGDVRDLRVAFRDGGGAYQARAVPTATISPSQLLRAAGDGTSDTFYQSGVAFPVVGFMPDLTAAQGVSGAPVMQGDRVCAVTVMRMRADGGDLLASAVSSELIAAATDRVGPSWGGPSLTPTGHRRAIAASTLRRLGPPLREYLAGCPLADPLASALEELRLYHTQWLQQEVGREGPSTPVVLADLTAREAVVMEAAHAVRDSSCGSRSARAVVLDLVQLSLWTQRAARFASAYTTVYARVTPSLINPPRDARPAALDYEHVSAARCAGLGWSALRVSSTETLLVNPLVARVGCQLATAGHRQLLRERVAAADACEVYDALVGERLTVDEVTCADNPARRGEVTAWWARYASTFGDLTWEGMAREAVRQFGLWQAFANFDRISLARVLMRASGLDTASERALVEHAAALYWEGPTRDEVRTTRRRLLRARLGEDAELHVADAVLALDRVREAHLSLPTALRASDDAPGDNPDVRATHALRRFADLGFLIRHVLSSDFDDARHDMQVMERSAREGPLEARAAMASLRAAD